MVYLAQNANPAPLPDDLVDAAEVLTTRDVAHAIGTSVQWVQELVARRQITAQTYFRKERKGHMEHFRLFTTDEVERFLRAKGKPSAFRQPRQLSLMLGIPGGRRPSTTP